MANTKVKAEQLEAAQTSITSVGTLSSLTVSGNTNATLTTAAQPNITSIGTLTTLTVDDITINGSTISDAADLTIDVGGDITLDADGGDILLKDGGTTFGQIATSSGDFHLLQPTSDKDIILRGLDGSTYIEALKLDMSEAGAATFNGEVLIPEKLTHAGDTDTHFKFAGANDIRIVAGNVEHAAFDVNTIVFNQSGADMDFRVESTGNASMLHVDAGNNRVGIGTNAPARLLEINTGGYNQLMIASAATSNSNKLAGIESRNYSNYALGLMQMFANSSQTGLYHGSADSSAKGVTDHYFMTSPSVDSTTNNIAMKINSAGNVDINDGDLSFASGHGISFAATGNSSGNLGSELLNDYEDGTWTPILIAGTTNPTGGGAQAPSGRYTKIGNRVWLTFYVGRSWTNTPAGAIYISGLPFTIHSSTNGFYPATATTYNVGFGDGVFFIPNTGGTTLQLYAMSSGASWGALNWSTHTSGTIIYVTGSISYHV